MAKKKTAGSAARGEAANAPSSPAPRRRRAAAPAVAATPASTADERAQSMPEPAGQDVTPANTFASDSVTFLAAPQAGDTGPSYEQIAEAAYHRYLSRGGQDGRDFDDWIEAEQELRTRS